MGKLSENDYNLTRRYLIWCYKTTKEDLDRIDRYYTQLDVDAFLLKDLRRGKEYKRNKDQYYRDLVDDFEKYMQKKKDNVDQKKFKDTKCKEMTTEYLYLLNRFDAIESAIIHFLGEDELDKICALYEEEMTSRILTAREHS